jgi:hypothetical protein
MEYLYAFGISLVASIIAVCITLVIERYRLPKLIISVSETNKPCNDTRTNTNWLFCKVKVENKISFIPKLITRQTAENCHATIEFYKEDNLLFALKGRWSSTPQLPDLPNDMWKVISNFPQTVSIIAGMSESLDILAQQEFENCAYGFNDSSYLHGWKNEVYELNEGLYKIKVNISTQNGVSFSSFFNLNITGDIYKTALIIRE